jgi:2-keto-4-pentenoate hydratase/2-oxohepta-3-ene-1,7-dioic acid hydratase in catechol pathway
MKFLRFEKAGGEAPGVLSQDGSVRDISGLVADIAPPYFAALAQLSEAQLEACPVVPKPGRVGPVVASVGKLICIGRNYSEHAKETGSEVPAEPVLFMKAVTAISGPNDAIVLPRGSEKTDWEVELGVVIGKEAKYVTEAEAFDYVFGYTIVHDVSERAFQLEGTGQWVKGKSADTFAPLGPWLVTKDEVKDPQQLKLWLEVNGERHQDGSTSDMIFGVAHLVSYISRYMRLLPGDVISTGTPPGVGLGLNPPVFLRAGDVVELGVEGLGSQRQEVVSEG